MTKSWRRPCLLVLCTLALASQAAAQDQAASDSILTLERARALARARAPAARAARAQVDVARGALVGASVWQPFNPHIEVGAGPRDGPASRSVDMEVALRQRFELGGQRQARVARARAGIDRAAAEAEAATQALVREVSIAFVQGVHAREALEVARENLRLADELRRVASRRHEVGDVGVLDVHVATVSHARARAEVRRREAGYRAATSRLGALLGLDGGAELRLQGSLAGPRRYVLDELVDRAAKRPELGALSAAMGEARAEERLARSRRWPDLGVFVRYGREEEAQVIVGGVSLEVPMFERGQGLQATSAARRRALELERDASRRMIDAQVRSAYDVYASLDDAARELQTEAMARVEQSLDLARRSYRAGSIAMGELLVLQRELVATRVAYLDVLLEAAVAGIELEAAAGVL